jgi:hypothetical protein
MKPENTVFYDVLPSRALSARGFIRKKTINSCNQNMLRHVDLQKQLFTAAVHRGSPESVATSCLNRRPKWKKVTRNRHPNRANSGFYDILASKGTETRRESRILRGFEHFEALKHAANHVFYEVLSRAF